MARLTEEDLLHFRREQQAAREKRNPSKSVADQDTSHSGTEVGRPTKKKKKNEEPASQKNKASNQTSLEQFMNRNDSPGANKGCSSSAQPVCWKNLLKEFEELTSNEVTSLWDSKIDFNSLVETNLVFEADREKMRKMGLKEACQAMMTKGLEIAAVAKMIDLESNGFDGLANAKLVEEKEKEIGKLKAMLKLLDKSNKANEKKAADLAVEFENAKKTAEDHKASVQTLTEENDKVKADLAQITTVHNQTLDENSKMKTEIAELQCSVLDQFEAGFAKALSQISFLNPDLAINLEGSNPYAPRMARLSEDDILRFRREQQAAREKRNPAKSIAEQNTSHSGTETDRLAKKKKKNDEAASAKNKTPNQTSLDQFMNKSAAIDMNKGCSSSAPPPCWKNLLKEFEELTSNEVTSLWDSKIDFNSLVETNLVFEADREKMRKIGLREACQAMMTKGLEIAAISKMIDLESAGFDGLSSAKLIEGKEKEVEKMRATLKLLEKSKKATDKKAADLASEVENLKKTIEENNTSIQTLTGENEKTRADLTQLTTVHNQVLEENSNLKTEVAELKCSILEQFEAGFAKAKGQIVFLNLDLAINLEGSNPYAHYVKDLRSL
ncbi:putative WEB family protein At1g65010, chloroplastic [Lotus japonicus]|uniref:putative WEB family protein At1g65010, chloroplastic n=1 Tax=Lotus japonicus TaxID=34305 RepID=UPI002582A764|nr:putative WEB family protein At1g65010, chloroplastic [Lotus japonicus]